MTPAAIVATLRARGARLQVLPDERIAVTPKGALDDALRTEIRSPLPELVAELRRTGSAAAPAARKAERATSPRVDYEAIYAELTAGAGTADDLAAVQRQAQLNGRWVA